jgi:hypothetical protein
MDIKAGNTLTPKSLATVVAQRLFNEGSFERGYGVGQAQAAASVEQYIPSIEDLSTSGLGIQGVGFADAGELRGVYIYASRGSASQLRKLALEVGDIPIVFHKMSPLRVYAPLSAASTSRGLLFQRGGRIACGSSCAPSNENYSGTFGALVRDQHARTYLLSNNHVLAACNHAAPGIPILSPSAVDSHASLPPPRSIGRHRYIVELRSGDATLVPLATVDAAMAEAEVNNVASWQGEGQDSYDTPSLVTEAVPGMRVKKWGRSTGFTTGVVESELAQLILPYKNKAFSAVVYFTEVYTIRGDSGDNFAIAGDSGSLVVSEDGTQAVGLVFATSTSSAGNYTVVASLSRTLSELELSSGASGLEVVSGHKRVMECRP